MYDAAETLLFNSSLKVIVKKNATDATLKVDNIAAGDTFKVGQKITVSLPRKGVDTDQRAFVSGDETIATVKEQADNKRVYDVQFLKAGEVTFTASAYQSAKYPYATAKQEIKVTVTNPVPTKAEAIAANAIELTFDEDVEAYGLFKDAKEIPYDAIYYLANETTKVNINAVKAVKATANKVKIDLFGTLLDNQQYFVELNGAKLDFVLANIGPKDVATIELTTTRATKDNATKIGYILRNKAGIDITASALEKGGSVSITQVDYNADIRGTGNANEYEIVMWTSGAVANLKAKYSFFDSNDNYKEYTAEAPGTITCVDESPLVFKKTVWSLIPAGALSEITSSETNLKHHFSLNEKNVYRLSVALVFTKDGKDQDDLNLGDGYDNGNIKVWFPDNNFAMFTAGSTISGNSAGTATAFIGYTKNGADKVIDVINVEVRGDKKASRIDLKLENDQKTLNVQAGSTDKITFVANVFDQYNEAIDIDGGNIVLNQIQASTSKGTLVDKGIPANLYLAKDGTNTGKYKLQVDNTFFTGVGANSVSLGFYVKNSYNGADVTSNNVYFNVAQKADLTGSVAFTSDNSALDTSVFDKVSKVTEDKAATLRIARNDGGFFTGAIKTGVVTTGTNSHTATQAGIGFQLEVLKNSTLINITAADYSDFITNKISTDGTIVVKGIVPVAGVIKKLATGTYTFRLFEYKMNTAGTFAVVQNPQVVTITVSDKQIEPVYKQVGEVTASAGADCFTYTFDGKSIHNLDDILRAIDYSDQNSNSDNVYVKTAKVKILVNLKSDKDAGLTPLPEYTYEVKVTIGKSLKIKK